MLNLKVIAASIFLAFISFTNSLKADIVSDQGAVVYRQGDQIFLRMCANATTASRSCQADSETSISVLAYNHGLIDTPIGTTEPMSFINILKEIEMSTTLDYTKFNDPQYMSRLRKNIDEARMADENDFSGMMNGMYAFYRVLTIELLIHKYLDAPAIVNQSQLEAKRLEYAQYYSGNDDLSGQRLFIISTMLNGDRELFLSAFFPH